MSQSFEESLLQAIKKDDIKAFDALNEKFRCGAFRMGRFPVLSLAYLYKSRKIISAHEETFLKITNYGILSEPVEISKRFSAKAGKCLRLYLNEIVTPHEMLMILDKTKRLKRIYPLTRQSPAVKERLKSIYYIKYSLNVKYEGDGIVIDRRPLSGREKKNIATLCLCSVLAVTVAVGAPAATVALIPKPVEGEVTTLSQIDFNSEKQYTLKQDIVLPENYSVEQVNCKINGEGNKLIFGKGAALGVLNGKISDLIIESHGDVIFSSVSEAAAIESVTLNVSADITTAEATALVAITNYGTIEGVTVNVSGKINALAASAEVTEELNFGGIVQSNGYKSNVAGLIKNCTVNYTQFELIGEADANASYGGVAGVNGGYLQDCTVTGEIIADTFDVAGVCVVNGGLLSGNLNEADLSQTSAHTDWNPITCGIVLRNLYAVENCKNSGKISSVSACGQFEIQENVETTASAAGIAFLNRGSANPYILNSTNVGGVDCSAQYRNVYAAGVCVSSGGGIESCKNSGDIAGNADNGCGIYVGGIASIAYGNIYKSVNEGAVSATGNGTAYAGGISAHSCARFSYCFSSGDITVAARNVCAGGVFGFGEVSSDGYYVYFGIADYCISESKINVTAIDGTPAYVGGIAGCVSEAGLTADGSVIYFGGGVTNCYFIGEYISEVAYFGNIVGVCGANIYESNSYISGGTEYHNFKDNFYLNNSLKALGATVSADGSFVSAEDKGAGVASMEDIQNSEAYQSILSALSS